MAEYELVREIENQCSRNQMRDVFIEELDIESPETYVRNLVKGEDVAIDVFPLENGVVHIHVLCGGVPQRFIFTPL